MGRTRSTTTRWAGRTTFGPVHINAAVYQQDWKNIQLSFLGANGLTEIRNAGVARIRGIELETGYNAGGLSATLAGSYNDATIRKDFCAIANPSSTARSTPTSTAAARSMNPTRSTPRSPRRARRLPVTPRLKGNAIVRYEFPIGSWDGHLQGALSYTGDRRSDLRNFENRLLGMLSGCTTADVSVGVENDRYRIELFATNLLDARGIIDTSVQCLETTCGDPDGISSTGGVFYDTVIKPRTVGLKLGMDF